MSDGVLNADLVGYGQAGALDTGPPPVISDPLVAAASPIEQLLRALGLAANSGDPLDDAAGLSEYAGRDAALTGVTEGFAGQDDAAAGQVSSVIGQIPQIAAGIAGALAGALQPITQIPQQIAQGAQQAMQAGAGLVAQYRGGDSIAGEDPAAADFPFDDELTDAAGDYGDGIGPGPATELLTGVAGGNAGIRSTASMALLGPSPSPSPGTAPASAPPVAPVAPPAAGPAPTPAGGMAGTPMIPPGPLHTGSDRGSAPPDTKKVTAPTVRNGAPVQGRIISPPSGPVAAARVEGRPVAGRRIALPVGAEEPGATA